MRNTAEEVPAGAAPSADGGLHGGEGPGDERPGDDVLAFEDFRLLPAKRMLTRNGAAVRLGARAFDILVTLAERSGQLVTKAELFAAVWPNAYIDESNLRVHVAALRKALGDGRSGSRLIASVTGRGYAFVADVARLSPRDGAGVPQPAPANDHVHLPAALVRVLGRDDCVAEIAGTLAERRFVTVTGPGGIGKTAVALAVAERVAGSYRHGVRFVDLAPIADGGLVAAHLASLLRLPAPDIRPLPDILAHLRARNMLLVFDNCEHMVTAAGELAEAILGHAPDVHVLATSREPLRARGEWLRRLDPLPVPPRGGALSAAAALRFPSVQLFVERLRAGDAVDAIDDADAPVIAEICARLDGLPLAIELAAAGVPLFGLRGVAERLDDRFAILTRGRRTSAARHRTLEATIDWSYATLEEGEKVVWRRLGVFSGTFSLDAAIAIGSEGAGEHLDVVEIVGNLVEKSLLAVDAGGSEIRYRLLESLRLYAFGKLLEHDEAACVRRRHAEHCLARAHAAGDGWNETPSRQWLEDHAAHVADYRAALDWALGPGGDAALAVALTAASAPFWFKLSVVPELSRYVDRALAAAASLPGIDDELVMRLHVAQAHAVFHTGGPSPAVAQALEAALAIARRRGDVDAQLQTLWALFGNHSTEGDLDRMRALVDAVRAVRDAHPDVPAAAAMYERVAALGCHLLGDQPAALVHARRALDGAGRPARDGGFVYDHRTSSSSHYCRALWVAGFPDQAAAVVRETVEHALGVGQPFSFGYFLVFGACPVSIWSGDLDALRRQVALLLDETIGIPFTHWRMGGQLYARVLAFLECRADGTDCALPLDGLPQTPSLAERLGTFDRRLLRPGPLAEALAGRENWCTAETLRAHGETLVDGGHAGAAAEAAALFERAIAIARRQGARAWELRAATSMARLHLGAGRRDAARDALAPVHAAFGEGAGTRDLRDARALLAAIG